MRLACWFSLVLLAAPAVAQATVADLVQQLGSRDGQKRNAAYRQLLANRKPEVIAAVAGAIEDLSRIGQELSCNVLRGFPRREVASVYKKMMSSATPYLRVVAVARLLPDYRADSDRSRRARAIKVLTKALAACKQDRVLSAVYACASVRDDAVFAQLRLMLRSDAAHVTKGVLRQLLNREGGVNADTQAAVTKLLTAKQSQVRGVAYAYLLHGDADHSEAFAKLLTDEPGVLWMVMDLLPKDKLHDALQDAIAAALAKPRSEHDIRRLAGVLRTAAPQKLKLALRGLVGHEKDAFRDEALAQLANMPGGFGEKDLMEMLHDKAMAVRVVAAGALRKQDNRAGLKPVIEAAKVRGKHQADAARVLGDYRSKQGVPVLLDLLDAADARVRNSAWSGLQETLRGLYPYRKFDFNKCGYAPNAASRQNGIATLRAWWASVE